MSADFWSLQNNADSALGGNLLNSDEFFLMPGQLSKTLTGNSSPEARYIGVMAEYQVPVVLEFILERVTNISMGVDIDQVVEFEELAERGEDAPTAIAALLD